MQIPFLTPELHNELQLRIHKVRACMNKEGVDAILIADNADIYYLSGCVFRGYVYLPIDREPIYFVIRPQTVAPDPQVAEIRKPELIASILEERGYGIPAIIGLEYDSIPYSDITRLEKVFSRSTPANASGILRNARMVKTDYEIAKMRIDGLHQDEVYRTIPRLYKDDMTDLEFQIEIERALRLEGCLGYTRVSGQLMEINQGSVISGNNADSPTPYDFAMGGAGVDPSLPVGANGGIMHPGTTVMIDMNGTFNGYQTDMTRVWRIGEIPELAWQAHHCNLEILRTLEKMALPGVEVCDLYQRAMQIVKDHHLEDFFMGHTQKAGFIGHGVGIQLNEQPAITMRNKTQLKEGMTIALEPKFVIPETGAVGCENTYLVTADGLEPLTLFPEEIPDLRN